MYLQISFGYIMPAFPFLQFDFSEAFCLIGGFVMGPLWGLGIVLLKNILHFSIDGNWVGHISNFIAVGTMTVVSSLIWTSAKKKQNIWPLIIIGLTIGVLIRIIIMIPANWLLITTTFWKENFKTAQDLNYYLIAVVPTFNGSLGTLSSILFVPLLKIYQSIIKKEE
jgi:riboflavin transporter FmnP